MPTTYTSFLGLALPATGELSGTWGTTVNSYISEYLDSAVAGVQTISGTQTAVALSVANGASLVQAGGAGATGSAQYMIINCTGTPASLLTISAPNASKVYVVINGTAQSVKLVGVTGPTTGVTLVTGEKAVCAWNGSDFVKVATSVADGVTSVAMTVPTLLSVSGSPITSTGTLALTYSGTPLPVANGGTGLTAGTSGGVLAYTATGTLASSAALAASALVIGGGAGAAPSTTTTGTGVVTALGVNTGTAGAFVVNGGALGTPASGTVTNLTGTASININGTVGATTPATGAFTTLSATGNANFGNAGSSTYGGYATGGRIFSLAAAGGVIPAISASTDTFAGSTAFRAYTKEIANDTSYAFEIQTGNGTGVTTQKLQLTWGANGLWNSTGLAVTGTLSATGTLSGGTSGTGYSFSGSAPATSLTLTAAGLLGIGTSSPATAGGKLTVQDAGTYTVSAWNATAVAANVGPTYYMQGGVDANNLGFIGAYFTGSTTTAGGYLTLGTRDVGGSTSEKMRLDSAGNLGLGVTPSAWGSSKRALQVGNATAIWQDGGGAGSVGYVSHNVCDDGVSDKYIFTDEAEKYLQAGGAHSWYIAPSGTAGNTISFTQAMTLDASGNLGIGTTSPSQRLHVRVATENSNIAEFGTFNTGRGLVIGTAADGAVNDVYVKYNAQLAGYGGHIWQIGGTERARIDSSGNLLVGTASTGLTNANSLSLEPSASGASFINHVNGSSSGNGYIFFGYNAGAIGSITQSGTTAVLYNLTSDQRLKENIQAADSASALIDSIQVRKFDWITDKTHQRYGFIAQELVTVAPEAVYQPIDPKEMMAVDYSKLVPLLVKEVQSLRARVAQLESKP